MSPKRRVPGLGTGLSLLLPVTVGTMAIVLLAPILPLLLEEFRAVPGAEYWVPMILTMPALCIALLSPVAGILGDMLGRRRLLIGSLAIYGAVGIAPIFLNGLASILVSRACVGIAEAAIIVNSTALIGDYFAGPARDRWLAAQAAVASVSALLFFNLGGFLGAISWRAPFLIYASALAMLALVLIFTSSEPARSKAEQEIAHAPREIDSVRFPWQGMAGVVIVTIFGGVLFYTVQIQAANGLLALRVSGPTRAGFLTSIASLGVPLGTFIYSRVNHRDVKTMFLAEFSILGCGFWLMGKAASPPIFLLGCAVNQIGAGLLLPTLLVWAMSQLDFAVRGRGTGFWQSAFAAGQFLSPLVCTAIGRQAGGLLPGLSWLGYASFGAAACSLTVRLFPSRALNRD